jgi:hypothetical protein
VRLYELTGPLKLSIMASNSSVILTWPANIVGRLQAQTNSGLSGLAAAWFEVTGATNPFVTARSYRSAFYRLASP